MGEVLAHLAPYFWAGLMLLLGLGLRELIVRLKPRKGLAAHEITTEEVRKAIAADQEFHGNLMTAFGEAVKHQEKIATALDRMDDRAQAQGELILALAESPGEPLDTRGYRSRILGRAGS